MKLAKARKTGNKLKVYRVKRKMTAADLSERSGVDRTAISNIENNRRRPRAETVLKLAFALGFEVESVEEAAEILGIHMSKSREAAHSKEPPKQEQSQGLTEDFLILVEEELTITEK